MEFYDPDTSSRPATAPMQVEVEPPPEPPPAAPKPVWEWAILGLAIAGALYAAWSQARQFSGGGLFVLAQIAYPLVVALVAAATTSLLLRRVLRAHRLVMSAEVARLRAEVQRLAREEVDPSR